ncbi:MAG TPA: aminopeptidase N [Candidatus Saccharimonadia bacterium]|nr:aminopeptidase N [Candidatus Saccharimonadia bacterium]
MHDTPAARTRSPTRLADHRPPAWRVVDVVLRFELDFECTRVHARLALERNRAVERAPIVLDGEGLALVSVALDGVVLEPGQYARDAKRLTLPCDDDAATVETLVEIAPARNTALEGLYRSGEFLLTQCEAEGFRHITFFPDRPDVMARYDVTLVAEPARFPVLLSNGNPAGNGVLGDGRHYARWVDPHPKPSYLFALVAGRLEHIEGRYRTAEGRDVALRIYADADAIGRCEHAMDCVVRAMRWDEQRFGRSYDLDAYHIVATNDFNQGAMENKGLNIFNAKFIVADTASATDADFRNVEGVVAHEYFHNWTGNRITCRDWFQLSLKEGLTVFRDQEFSADMNSRAVKRIEDVRGLRAHQFPEDAGPFAHAVRPDTYLEINNFYTATVYEKGAEVVRLLHTVLGEQAFRRGMDLYFERHDGEAVTCEDFVRALGDASSRDLSPFLAWYSQAGTPQLRVSESHDAAARSYTLSFTQGTPPTPGQPDKRPLPIPVRLALYRDDGEPLPLTLAHETTPGPLQRVVLIDQAEQQVVFRDVAARPRPSLLQDFSAPVHLHREDDAATLAFLARHDRDALNRWDAIQRLAERAVLAEYARTGAGSTTHWFTALTHALDALLADAALDAEYVAECLELPEEAYLAELLDHYDPERLYRAREAMQRALAEPITPRLLAQHRILAADPPLARDGAAVGRRRLRNAALALLVRADPVAHSALARAQLEAAGNMTDRLAALTLLVHGGIEGAQRLAERFYQQHRHDPLVVDKWLTLQATNPQPGTLERVERLTEHPAFTLRNPNKVRALVGAFARANRVRFHAVNGEGYRFVGGMVLALDPLNPQVAARIAGVFNGWRRLEPLRRTLMRSELERLAGAPQRSSDLAEIVQRALS